MAKHPTLTTVLVNYNHARFLPESLGAILKQTRLPDELIVIDDKSIDSSVSVIREFLPRHPNARLIENPVNQGCFANVNDGVRAAVGDFLHFASADDVIFPRFYEAGLSLLQAYGGSVFSSRSAIVDEYGRESDVPSPWAGMPLETDGYLSPQQSLDTLMREDGWFMGNVSIFRRSSVLEYGGLPVDLQSFADGFMCRYLSLKEGACFSHEVLGAWRRMDSGFASSVSSSPERYANIIENAERRMLSAPDVFPASYVKRWRGRQEFEVRRRALARARAGTANSGPLTRRFSSLKEKWLAALLLAKYRPWDIIANIRQRFAVHRGRI